VVRSIAGSDVVEPIGRRSQSIEPPIRYEGEGPVETVVSTGVPGLRNVYFGTISRETVRTETATVPTPKVVRLSAPPSGAKVVALTFDDGPWPGSTEKILSILERYNVKATFFMLGKQASSKPALAKKVVAAGMALGNHTINHPNLTKLSASAIAKQVQGAESQILAASGARPKYFRPPGGAMNSAVAAELARDDLKLVEWGIDTEDWKKPGVSSIVARCVGGVRPGVVILMHDGGGDRSQTAAALPMVIEQLRAKGYVFVTLDYISELPSRMG
jgi:peptidoglycan/xylan/chitin deacetylase (PgdA/CDA1 family)